MNGTKNVVTVTATPSQYGNTSQGARPVAMKLDVDTCKVKTYVLSASKGWMLTGRGKLEGSKLVNQRPGNPLHFPEDRFNFLPNMSKACKTYFASVLEKAYFDRAAEQYEDELFAKYDNA